MMDKAFGIYQKAKAIEASLLSKKDSLEQEKNGLNVQGRALTTEEQERILEIEKWNQKFQDWQAEHPEIPGYEEGHVHGAGCTHGKGKQLEILPEDWLKVQEEFLERIMDLEAKASNF